MTAAILGIAATALLAILAATWRISGTLAVLTTQVDRLTDGIDNLRNDMAQRHGEHTTRISTLEKQVAVLDAQKVYG